jgi:peptidoglycan/LPS O-acetylase OafA/YrhL
MDPSRSAPSSAPRLSLPRAWPALDGCRALFVLAVLLAHARIPYTHGGGELGVTGFFVLSGFLITRLLVREHESTGGIDFPSFYARRALRLLPALLLLITTALVAYGTRGRAAVILSAAGPTLMYSSNWLLAFHGDLEPFQQTWSLAIEEQFYLIWPMTLLAALRWLPSPRSRWFASLALFGALASWRAGLWLACHDPLRIYFGSDTNALSLVFGVVIALAPALPRPPFARLLVPVGLLLFALGVMASELLHTSVPQDQALIPPLALLGSGALVVGALHGSTLLELAPLRYLGRISYGVYLWSWTLPKILGNFDRDHQRIALYAPWLGFVCAVVSYHLIEQRAIAYAARTKKAPLQA